MKLPYNETYCFCLENMDDLGLFDKYINPDLSPSIWNPLEYITRMDISLPQYVYIIKQPNNNLAWDHKSKIPEDKTVIPLAALSNAEKYPEFLI